MSRLRKFDLHSSQSIDIVQERTKFVNRINQTLFQVYYNSLNVEVYNLLFERVCYILGVDPSEFYDNDIVGAVSGTRSKFHLKHITKSNFEMTLRAIIAFDEAFEEHTGSRNSAIDNHVRNALELANIDLGIMWQGGMFFPTGAKELDEALVGEVLKWLNDFPDAKRELKNALEKYHKKNLDRNLIDDLRLCLELLLKKLLSNSKSLEKQKESLGEFLKGKNVSVELRNIYVQNIDLYTKYQNEVVKHNNRVRKEEVEFILYLTGTFIRFLSKL